MTGIDTGMGRDGRRIESLAIEGWSPRFGSPVENDGDEVPAARVDPGPELPAEDWRPLGSGEESEARVYFIDGVRRIEARVWITGPGQPRPGICASYAAGVVRCGRRAKIVSTAVRRGLFGRAEVPELTTRAGRFRGCPVAGDDMQQLVNGLQERMGRLEIEVAGEAGSRMSEPFPEGELFVMDGPLRGRQRIPGAIGYVKSHRVRYLPAGPREVVARLAPRRRTPVFLIQTTWTRYSWYLRLSEAEGHPWSGIVRCEAWSDTPLEQVTRVANLTAAVLPRFASAPHKDDRAPQNLYPIAGLERELRRLLGDRGLVYRALRRAVREYSPAATPPAQA